MRTVYERRPNGRLSHMTAAASSDVDALLFSIDIAIHGKLITESFHLAPIPHT